MTHPFENLYQEYRSRIAAKSFENLPKEFTTHSGDYGSLVSAYIAHPFALDGETGALSSAVRDARAFLLEQQALFVELFGLSSADLSGGLFNHARRARRKEAQELLTKLDGLDERARQLTKKISEALREELAFVEIAVQLKFAAFIGWTGKVDEAIITYRAAHAVAAREEQSRVYTARVKELEDHATDVARTLLESESTRYRYLMMETALRVRLQENSIFA